LKAHTKYDDAYLGMGNLRSIKGAYNPNFQKISLSC
jgi:hypothetical protein